jgi:hypothetical protein
VCGECSSELAAAMQMSNADEGHQKTKKGKNINTTE